METEQERNKRAVLRFNKEAIEQGLADAFEELLDPSFINHTAPAGMPKGKEGMIRFIRDVLHPAFSDLRVEVYDQIAEGDKVVTRKAFKATHTGMFMDVAPTGKAITFPVIDIIRLRDGKYIEHWGIRDTYSVLRQLTTEAR